MEKATTKQDRDISQGSKGNWDSFSASMTVEGACGYETDDFDTYVSAAQYLIDTGLAWSLQGFFGRTCMDLINAGHCHRN